MACRACYIYYLVNLQYTILHPPQLIPLIDGVLDVDAYQCGVADCPLRFVPAGWDRGES
jgi:hypothetical protein